MTKNAGPAGLDRDTGLCWEDPVLNVERTWQEAMDYCDELRAGRIARGSWRLRTDP